MKNLLFRYATHLIASVYDRRNMTSRSVLAIITYFAFWTPAYAAPGLSRGRGEEQGYGSHHAGNTNHNLRSVNNNTANLRFDVILTDKTQATAIERGLAESGFKAKFHAATRSSKPYFTAEIDRGVDLNQLLGSLSAASEISSVEACPFYDLIIYASLDNEAATSAMDQLSGVSGVDATHSTADIVTGELHVRIAGDSPVTADDISEAMGSAGIAGSFGKTPASDTKVTSGIRKAFAFWPSWLTWRTGRVSASSAPQSVDDRSDSNE